MTDRIHTVPRPLYDVAYSMGWDPYVLQLFNAAYKATGARPGDTLILCDEEEIELARVKCGENQAIYGEDGE